MIFALDTNILTYFLKKDERVAKRINEATASGHTLILSPIVDYEIQRGLLAKKMAIQLDKYLAVRQTIPIGVFDEEVWVGAAEIYASLRRRGKLIDDVDILIASFCLANGYCLVTNNTRHFENIEGLQLTNWKDEE